MIFDTGNLTFQQMELLQFCDDLEKFILDLENTIYLQISSSDTPVLLCPYFSMYLKSMEFYKKDLEILKKKIKKVQ